MDQDKINWIRPSKYEQPPYNFFKNMNFAFHLYCILSIEKLSSSNRTIKAQGMRTMLFRKIKIYLDIFLNYDIIIYAFQDIKLSLKNLPIRKLVLYNYKYFNEYYIWKHDLKKLRKKQCNDQVQ